MKSVNGYFDNERTITASRILSKHEDVGMRDFHGRFILCFMSYHAPHSKSYLRPRIVSFETKEYVAHAIENGEIKDTS